MKGTGDVIIRIGYYYYYYYWYCWESFDMGNLKCAALCRGVGGKGKAYRVLLKQR